MEIILAITLGLGGVGLLLAMPRGPRPAGAAPVVLLGAAGALLIGLLAALLTGGAPAGWFVPLALVAVAAAIRVVTHPRPVYSALYFILVVVAVAGLLVLMQAEFLAAALIIIYAGAILVTYIFVIMLAQQSGEAPCDRRAHEPFLAVLGGFVLLGTIGAQLLAPTVRAGIEPAPPLPTAPDGVVEVGSALLTRYAVGVELAGLLLLAAMVGAIAIARRRATQDADAGGESC